MTIKTDFIAYHKANPSVYSKLHSLAMRLKRVGAKRYGMKALFEILRFNALLQSDEKFKLSNNYTSHYARLLMKQEPELAGFFTTRPLRSN